MACLKEVVFPLVRKRFTTYQEHPKKLGWLSLEARQFLTQEEVRKISSWGRANSKGKTPSFFWQRQSATGRVEFSFFEPVMLQKATLDRLSGYEVVLLLWVVLDFISCCVRRCCETTQALQVWHVRSSCQGVHTYSHPHRTAVDSCLLIGWNNSMDYREADIFYMGTPKPYWLSECVLKEYWKIELASLKNTVIGFTWKYPEMHTLSSARRSFIQSDGRRISLCSMIGTTSLNTAFS